MSGALDDSLTDSKWVLESRRFWGFVTMALPFILQAMGISLSPAENAQAAAIIQHAQSSIAEGVSLIGAVQLFYGSWKARQPLHLLTPYQVDTSGKKVAPVVPMPLTADVAMMMDNHPVT